MKLSIIALLGLLTAAFAAPADTTVATDAAPADEPWRDGRGGRDWDRGGRDWDRGGRDWDRGGRDWDRGGRDGRRGGYAH